MNEPRVILKWMTRFSNLTMRKLLILTITLFAVSSCDRSDPFLFSVTTDDSAADRQVIVTNLSDQQFSKCSLALNSNSGGFRDFEQFSLQPGESHAADLMEFQNQRREFPLGVRDVLLQCGNPYLVEHHKHIRSKKGT
jgi:hypothetical protein